MGGQRASSPITVAYSAETGDHTIRGSNYDSTANTGTVTIPAGQKTAEIEIAITDDGTYGGDGMVVLTLTEGLYTVGTPGVYRLTIKDDDDPDPSLPVVRIADRAFLEVVEGESGGRPAFRVVGDVPAGGLPVTIQYAGGTATLNEDFEFYKEHPAYRGPSREPFRPPSARGETFTITARANEFGGTGVHIFWIEGLSYIEDGERDGGETVIFRLVNGPGYVVEGDPTLTVTLRD